MAKLLPILFSLGAAFWAALLVLREQKTGEAYPAIWLVRWLCIFLLPYVLFGPASFLWMDDEGDLVVPQYLYRVNGWESGPYSHLMGSGADTRSSFVVGGEYVSIEAMLMSLLPLWLAIAVHKALTASFGFVGCYLVCTRMVGASRFAAIAVSTLFTVFYFRMVLVTYGTGMGYAVIPIGIYCLVGRLGQRHYWLGAFIYSALAALYVIPNEGYLALVSAILASSVIVRAWDYRPVGGLAIVSLAVILNWIDSLLGMMALASDSFRAALPRPEVASLVKIFSAFETYAQLFLYQAKPALVLIALGIAAALWYDRRFLVWACTAMLVPPAMVAVFHIVPWHMFGMAWARYATINYFLYGVFPIAAMIGARGITLLVEGNKNRAFPWDWKALPCMVLVAAFAINGWYAGYSLATLHTNSGQALYRVENLLDRTWQSKEPLRAITLRSSGLPDTNVLFGVYGIPAFDAWLNLADQRHATYWTKGVLRHNPTDMRVGIDWTFWRNGQYHVDETISLPMLAAANVGYIISPVPLAGIGIQLLDGPERPPLSEPAYRSWKAKLDFYLERLGRVLDIGKVYVYGIQGAVPRVYPVEATIVVDDNLPVDEYLKRVEREAPKRRAVVRETAARMLPLEVEAVPNVRSFEMRGTGFEIEIDAPQGGLIAVNALASRHLQAFVDGAPVPIVEANGVQMVIPVRAGAKHIEVRYNRLTLRSMLTNLAGI